MFWVLLQKVIEKVMVMDYKENKQSCAGYKAGYNEV